MAWDGEGVDPWLPQRLAGELEVVQAERKLYNSWLGSIAAWLTKVHRAVLGSGRPDPTGVFAFAEDWTAAMDRWVTGPVKQVMGAAYEILFGSGYKYDTRPAVVEHLAGVRNRMVRTPDEVFGLVASEVARGATAGSSISTIADRVDEILSVTATDRWRNRAVAVARTESGAALNAGRVDSFRAVQQDIGLEMEQMWLATMDSRTRPAHRAADGQRVPLGEPFIVGGESLAYPGDPAGSARNTVNCRCTTLLVMPGEEVDMTNRQFLDAPLTIQEAEAVAVKAAKTPPAPDQPAPKLTKVEEAAVKQQARVSAASAAGSAAAEIDEIINNLEGDIFSNRDTVNARISSLVARGQIPAEVGDALRKAVSRGDADALSAAAWAHAGTVGASRLLQAGEVTRFRRREMDALEPNLRSGTPVEVIRPGVYMADEDAILSKAVVDEADIDIPRFHHSLTSQQAAVARLRTQTPIEERRLGGDVGDTYMLTYTDERKLVRKSYGARIGASEDEAAQMIDAEQLATLVLQAVGLQSAAALRTGRNEIWFSWVDGVDGSDLVPWGGNVPKSIIDSHDGKLLGLADHLLMEEDRHPGNWIRTEDGRLIGLDHGASFGDSRFSISAFATYLYDAEASYATKLVDNPFTKNDMRKLRERLVALESDFELLGRESWFKAMIRRLNELERHAKGTKDLLP